ncbi:MAG: trigger factor [Deltaproteobacteria bacterium]|nr:trigger factor [Deltaproteobacteria bacterium]
MQVSVEDVSPLTKTLKIVVPEDVVARKIEDAYKELQAEVSIKGFRKGKVPRKVLEKGYGEKIKMEVGEKLVQDTYFDALEKTDCKPVVHPEIKSHKFADDGTFIYEAEIDVKPQFEMGQYKGIEVEMPKIVVSDETVAAEIESLRKEMAPLRNVDERGVMENDLVVVDFQGYDANGEAIRSVKAENYSVEVGSGRQGKEFESACLGLRKGEETSRAIEFPPSFPNPILAGKKVEFKIVVKEVKERVLAEVNDEFAQDVGEEFTTLDLLKEHVRRKIEKQRADAQSGDLTDKIMLKILEKHDFAVPDKLVAYEVNEQIKQLEDHLQKQGLTLESAGMSQEKLVENYKDAAAKRVRGDFILKKIAEVEDIKLTDEDISKGFERIASQYGMPVDEVKKYFRSRNELLPFMNELLSEKILEFLRTNAVVKEISAEAGGDESEKAGASA